MSIRWLLVSALLAACGDVADNTKKDAGADAPVDACVAETDTELCAAAESCEMHAFTDRCGATRNVDCGTCTSGKGCVVGACKTPVCSSFNYASTTLTLFSVVNVEDSLTAATPDFQTIVYIPTGSGTCGSFQIVIADEIAPGSGTYNKQNITTLLATANMTTGQDSYTISADGLTLIGRNATNTAFLALKRSARGMTDFGTPDPVPFQTITDQVAAFGANARITGPVLSADGLQFLYSVVGATAATNNGIYSTERASATAAFPAGTKLGAPVSDYAFATALSSDRLTIFVFDNFQGRVFTRTSTTGAWVNPNAPAPAPVVSGWQHKPSADCSKLISMASPGGCANEDIKLHTRQ